MSGKQLGLHTTHHKYDYDIGIWNKECDAKYYLMGLWASDGTISRNRDSKFIELSLNKKDEVLLNDIRKTFKTDKPLHLGKDNCLKFTLYSNKSYDYLTSWGIGEKKSLSLQLTKEIPPQYYISFLRGVFDGDGSITQNISMCADITLALTASAKFAEQICTMYDYHNIPVQYHAYKHHRKNPLYMIKKSGKMGLKILAKMYNKAELFLPSKYEQFIQHTRLTTDENMMEMAHTVKQRSACIRWKVGCVITNSDRTNITAIGYNGQARGEPNHCESTFAGECGCIHAEPNALVKNNLNGTILYCTGLPCKQCAKLIVDANIQQVFYDEDYRYCYAIGLFQRQNIRVKQIKRKKYQWKLNILS